MNIAVVLPSGETGVVSGLVAPHVIFWYGGILVSGEVLGETSELTTHGHAVAAGQLPLPPVLLFVGGCCLDPGGVRLEDWLLVGGQLVMVTGRGVVSSSVFFMGAQRVRVSYANLTSQCVNGLYPIPSGLRVNAGVKVFVPGVGTIDVEEVAGGNPLGGPAVRAVLT